MLLFILRRILLIHAVIVMLTIITVKVGVFTVTHQSDTTDSLSASPPTDSLYVNTEYVCTNNNNNRFADKP